MGEFNLVPFSNNANSLASIKATAAALAGLDLDEFVSGIKAGFPVLRIRGKNWRTSKGGEETLIMDPERPKEPARSINVIVLRAAQGLSKTCYLHAYDKDAPAEAPDCYSGDGITPAADAKLPQAQTCATCPNNVWGSKVNDNGKKGKLCQDNKRLAVASPTALHDPMLLIVPPSSFEGLKRCSDYLKTTFGLAMPGAVIQLGFDHEAEFPKVTWTPVGPVPVDHIEAVMEARDSDLVMQICGGDVPATALYDVSAPAPAAAPKTEAKAPAQKAAPKATPKPAPVPKAEPVAAEAPDDILAGLDAMLAENGIPEQPVEEEQPAPISF